MGTHALRQDLGRTRRPHRRRRHVRCSTSTVTWCTKSPALRAYEGLRQAGRKVWRVSSVVATADHNTPTTGWNWATTASPDPISKEQITTLNSNIAEFGAAAFFPFMSKRPGHRACDRPGKRRHPARHDGGVRRQPHLHPWCLRRIGARHRHQRGGTRAGHADPAGQEGQKHAGSCRRATRQGLHRQRHRAGHHRQDRHRRRHGLHHRIRRLRDPSAQHRRPHDGLQHGHRMRRTRRLGGV